MNQTELTIERAPALSELVCGKIEDAIAEGQFPAGSRLVEADLASRFGVSRGPVREALQLLSTRGLVHGSGRGMTVSKPSVEELERMILVRALLEGCAARLFVLQQDKAALAGVEEVVRRMRAAAAEGELDRFRELHWKFHETICASVDNGFLLRAWQSLRATLRVFARLNLGSKAAMSRIVSNHQAMLAALQGSNADAAEATVRGLILVGGYALLEKELPPGLLVYTAGM